MPLIRIVNSRLSIPNLQLLAKALVLSVLIHLILLNAFTFYFPSPTEIPQPKFYFLGSILKKQDTNIKTASAPGPVNFSANFMTIPVPAPGQSVLNVKTEKPAGENPSNRDHIKPTTKSIFPMANRDVPHAAQTQTPVDIDPDNQIYKPLRLYHDDSP